MSQRKQLPKKAPKRGPSKQISQKIPTNLPAFPGQVVQTFHLPITPILVTSSAVGLINTLVSLQASSIQNFSARFGNLFEEYRIVAALFRFKCFSQSNPGLLTHWIDEKQAGAPTLTEAQQKSEKEFSASSSERSHSIMWTAHDPLDLQYTDINITNVIPVNYKVYGDAPNFGLAVTTPYGQLCAEVWVQFRGLN